MLFKFNFFDSLVSDLPNSCWSLQTDSSKSLVNLKIDNIKIKFIVKITIRSLAWPGYVGYHKSNTKIFGGLYIGDGVKNVDLPFQLK